MLGHILWRMSFLFLIWVLGTTYFASADSLGGFYTHWAVLTHPLALQEYAYGDNL